MYVDNVILQLLFAVFAGIFLFLGITLTVRKLPIAYRILGVSFVNMGLNLVIFYLTATGLLYTYPHFTRIGSPLTYLWGPLMYLFAVYLVYPNVGWKRWYWLFFIPAGVHLLEMMPFFLSSADEKREFLMIYFDQKLLSSPNGILSFRTHMVLKSAMVFGFCLAMYYVLRPILLNRNHLLFGKNKLLLNWLLTGLGIKTVTAFMVLMGYVLFRNISKGWIAIGYYLAFADSLFYAVYLLVHPNLLQGIQWRNVPLIESEPVPTPDVEKEVSDLQPIENTENQSILVQESKKERPTEKPELLRLMDQYMQFDQPYLNSNLSVELVAKKLGVKPYRLSQEIKEYYGISFSDLVNSYRLNFIDEKLRMDELWKTYSIETMALRSGFGSRAAFYVAFRKLKNNIAPTTYYGLK